MLAGQTVGYVELPLGGIHPVDVGNFNDSCYTESK